MPSPDNTLQASESAQSLNAKPHITSQEDDHTDDEDDLPPALTTDSLPPTTGTLPGASAIPTPPSRLRGDWYPNPTTNNSSSSSEPQKRIPLTILTGYLGSGKTTLLNHLLSVYHGYRIAIILNEFGDSFDIERQSLVTTSNPTNNNSFPSDNGSREIQEFLEVGNGCICCSVKDAGVQAIEQLVAKRGGFDYILLETSGLANPGNLVKRFWVDEGLGSCVRLDGVVTVVDGANLERCLSERMGGEGMSAGGVVEGEQELDEGITTAHLQISHADVVVVNKVDRFTGLEGEVELDRVKQRVRGINGLAKIETTSFGRIERLQGTVLDLKAYDDVDLKKLEEAKGARVGWERHLDPTISTLAFELPSLTERTLQRLDSWLQSILWERELPSTDDGGAAVKTGFDIHRLKGLLTVVDETGAKQVKMVQGVREIFDITELERKEDQEPVEQGKLVLIGRHIQGLDWEKSLKAWLARD